MLHSRDLNYDFPSPATTKEELEQLATATTLTEEFFRKAKRDTSLTTAEASFIAYIAWRNALTRKPRRGFEDGWVPPERWTRPLWLPSSLRDSFDHYIAEWSGDAPPQE